MDGTDFTGHYVIIGWNDLARTVIKEMLTAGFPVAAEHLIHLADQVLDRPAELRC